MLAATDAREFIREQILAITSDLRNGVEVLIADPADPSAVETLQQASRSFNEVAKQNSLRSLIPSASIIERVPAIADALRWARPEEIPVFLAGTSDVLGSIEEVLDWCLEEEDTDRQARLVSGLCRSFPDRWRTLLEADGDTFEHQLKELTRPTPASAPRTATTLPPRRSAAPLRAAAAAPASAPSLQRTPISSTASANATARRSTARSAIVCNVPAELVETFEAEAVERIQRCEELLVRLEQEPEHVDVVHGLLRELHTLKGAAAEVGLDLVRNQIHDGESLLAAIRDGSASLDPSLLVDFLFRLLDSVRGILDQARGRDDSAYEIIDDVAGEIAALLSNESQAENATAATALPDADAELSDGTQLPDLAQLRERLAAAVQDPEVLRLIEALDRQAREYSQMAVGFKEELDRLRLMPLDDIFRPLLRPVRDAARQEGKRAQLTFAGGDTRVDREVGERLHGCLLHLVRNAVSHGIEPPATREAAGKPPVGSVRVHARIADEHLELSVEDDGAGLDFDAIRARAEEKGWIAPAQPTARDELAHLIFRPGFSTRIDVDDLAGRGVGLDVVSSEVAALGGRIDIQSSAGAGTVFLLTLPLSGGSRSTTSPPEPPPRQRPLTRPPDRENHGLV